MCVPHAPNPDTFGSAAKLGGSEGLQSPNWGRRGPELGEPWGLHSPSHAQGNPQPWEEGGKTSKGRERLRGEWTPPEPGMPPGMSPPGTSVHLVLPGAGAEEPDGVWGGSGGLLPSPRAGLGTRNFGRDRSEVGASSPTAPGPLPAGGFSAQNVAGKALLSCLHRTEHSQGIQSHFSCPEPAQLQVGGEGPVWSGIFVPAPPGDDGRNNREMTAEILGKGILLLGRGSSQTCPSPPAGEV